eukprot:GILK01023195.1.p1 GENE.GILK01023195.1~~GILK01023195.1.p1  ORF type:complete len:297 (+),score=29.43 GILK01023195.1:181-1071(+)
MGPAGVVLDCLDMWEMVLTGPPAAPAPGSSEQIMKEYSKALRINSKARNSIIKKLDRDHMHYAIGTSTAKELWLKLETAYESKGQASALHLHKKLLAVKWDKTGDLRRHLGKIATIVNELNMIGEKVSTTRHILHVLQSLPAEYKPVRVDLESDPNSKNYEYVVSRLRDAEIQNELDKMELHGQSETQQEGDGTTAFNSSEARGRLCHHCHQPGHFIKECPDRGGYRGRGGHRGSYRGQGNRGFGRRTYFTTHSSNDQVTFSSVLETSSKQTQQQDRFEWILDSGGFPFNYILYLK